MEQTFLDYWAAGAHDLLNAIANGGYFTEVNHLGIYQVYAACSNLDAPVNEVRFVSAGPWLG